MTVETLSRDDRGNLIRHHHHDLDRVVGVFVMKIQNVTIRFNNDREVTFKGEAQVTDEDVTAGVAGITFTDPYEDPATKGAETTIPVSITDAPKDES